MGVLRCLPLSTFQVITSTHLLSQLILKVGARGEGDQPAL